MSRVPVTVFLITTTIIDKDVPINFLKQSLMKLNKSTIQISHDMGTLFTTLDKAEYTPMQIIHMTQGHNLSSLARIVRANYLVMAHPWVIEIKDKNDGISEKDASMTLYLNNHEDAVKGLRLLFM